MLPKRVLLLFAAATALPAAAAERTVTLGVETMTWALCQISVARASEAVPGGAAVTVDTTRHIATVAYGDARATAARVAEAATEAGYPARVVAWW